MKTLLLVAALITLSACSDGVSGNNQLYTLYSDDGCAFLMQRPVTYLRSGVDPKPGVWKTDTAYHVYLTRYPADDKATCTHTPIP